MFLNHFCSLLMTSITFSQKSICHQTDSKTKFQVCRENYSSIKVGFVATLELCAQKPMQTILLSQPVFPILLQKN